MCAWKYPQTWFENKDVIEPSDWRLNAQEFLGEVNGQLDNDNLHKKMFDHDTFRTGTFNTFYKSNIEDTFTVSYFDHAGGGGWQSIDRSDVGLPSVIVNAKEDGLVIVDATTDMAWQNYDSAGISTIWYSYWRPNGTRIKVRSAYILCAMFRVTCNGLSVCETGPIGNEFSAQPVYLCGSIPISAGQNKIQFEARFVWYSPGTDKYVEASSKNPKNETTDGSGEDTSSNRQDVALFSRLYVNHRKR